MIGCERGDSVGEDAAAGDVGPVMHDVTEVVNGRAWKMDVSARVYGPWLRSRDGGFYGKSCYERDRHL